MVDSVKGQESLAAAIPGVLELLNIPYTGTGMLGMALDTNKFFIKELLQRNGMPVPIFQLFTSADDYLNPTLRFPVISKLNAIHGSVEITREAVSENEKQLRKRLRKLIRLYHQPVLVEEFVGNREITAILLEGKHKKVYMAEKIFRHTEGPYVFLTFEDQWLTEMDAAFYLPALPRPGAARDGFQSLRRGQHERLRQIRRPPGRSRALLFHRHELQPCPGTEGARHGSGGDPGPVRGFVLRGPQAAGDEHGA